MALDISSALMLVNLVAKGLGVAKSLQDLAKRIENGEKITEKEVEVYLKKNKEALDRWNSFDAQKK